MNKTNDGHVYILSLNLIEKILDFVQDGGLACAMLRVDNRGRGGWTPGGIASTGLNGRGNGPFASVDSVELRLDDKAWSDGFGRDEDKP